MNKLTKEDILMLHAELIAAYGGADGMRDEWLLDSAIYAPFQTFGGENLYPTLQLMAAGLGFGLIKNHPFIDGNKRLGAHVMIVFLAINGVELEYTQQELIEIILAVASGKVSMAGLAELILRH